MNSLFPDENKAYFISRDAKGKIRCVSTYFDNEGDVYTIHRYTYQYGGKRTEQPKIVIDSGKQGRDPHAQCILRFMAICKEYRDKGYKEIEEDPDTYAEEELDNILPEFNTDANGFAKHMLAKPIDKCKESTIYDIPYWYGSRKIDGVRVSLYYDKGKIKTASRGGGDYDYACQHFIQNPQLIAFFEKHPKVILDGELYKHGWPLQKISGAARLEKNAVDCDSLEFYMYDIMVPKISFKLRNKIMDKIQEELNLRFDPYREWNKDELQIQRVPQEVVEGKDIMSLHNKYVSEGWEGLVIRNPDAEYGFGRRTKAMIKVKKYKDAEFIVRSYELGLRGTEDMVFICETPYGNRFKAKPMGDRETRQYYVDNFNKMFKDRFATVKYFYYSNDNNEMTGVPLQPVLKRFRNQID